MRAQAQRSLDLPVDARDYRQCAEVIFDLGQCKVKVISNNPGKLLALEEAGLEMLSGFRSKLSFQSRRRDMQSKKERMVHLLDLTLR